MEAILDCPMPHNQPYFVGKRLDDGDNYVPSSNVFVLVIVVVINICKMILEDVNSLSSMVSVSRKWKTEMQRT